MSNDSTITSLNMTPNVPCLASLRPERLKDFCWHMRIVKMNIHYAEEVLTA